MTGAIVCYAKCWPCQFGQCYDPPKPHTWMDEEDIEFDKSIEKPESPEAWRRLYERLAAEEPCACRCAGQRGGCVFIPGGVSR